MNDLELRDVLTRLVDSCAISDEQYMVSANYYEHQTKDRLGERWHLAMIWLCRDSAWNVKLTDQGLVCDVKLNQTDPNDVSTILLPFDQIWTVSKLGEGPIFTDRDAVYLREEKFTMPKLERAKRAD